MNRKSQGKFCRALTAHVRAKLITRQEATAIFDKYWRKRK